MMSSLGTEDIKRRAQSCGQREALFRYSRVGEGEGGAPAPSPDEMGSGTMRPALRFSAEWRDRATEISLKTITRAEQAVFLSPGGSLPSSADSSKFTPPTCPHFLLQFNQ